MFYLDSEQLLRLVVEQPMLLTSSIDRNLDIASFFSGEVGLGLSPREINSIVTGMNGLLYFILFYIWIDI